MPPSFVSLSVTFTLNSAYIHFIKITIKLYFPLHLFADWGSRSQYNLTNWALGLLVVFCNATGKTQVCMLKSS